MMSMQRITRIFSYLIISTVIGGVISGCSTAVHQGGLGSIAINSDPQGADCSLTRTGQDLGSVITPDAITVRKGRYSIYISCKKDGFQVSNGRLKSKEDLWVFGNVVIWNVFGLAVDAGTGAAFKYPSTITVTLIPESFPTIGERDAFFAKLEAQIQKKSDELMERAIHDCSNEMGCVDRIEWIKNATWKAFDELDQKKQQAQIG